MKSATKPKKPRKPRKPKVIETNIGESGESGEIISKSSKSSNESGEIIGEIIDEIIDETKIKKPKKPKKVIDKESKEYIEKQKEIAKNIKIERNNRIDEIDRINNENEIIARNNSNNISSEIDYSEKGKIITSSNNEFSIIREGDKESYDIVSEIINEVVNEMINNIGSEISKLPYYECQTFPLTKENVSYKDPDMKNILKISPKKYFASLIKNAIDIGVIPNIENIAIILKRDEKYSDATFEIKVVMDPESESYFIKKLKNKLISIQTIYENEICFIKYQIPEMRYYIKPTLLNSSKLDLFANIREFAKINMNVNLGVEYKKNKNYVNDDGTNDYDYDSGDITGFKIIFETLLGNNACLIKVSSSDNNIYKIEAIKVLFGYQPPNIENETPLFNNGNLLYKKRKHILVIFNSEKKMLRDMENCMWLYD